jgi:hypothetical protein
MFCTKNVDLDTAFFSFHEYYLLATTTDSFDQVAPEFGEFFSHASRRRRAAADQHVTDFCGKRAWMDDGCALHCMCTTNT